MKASGTRTVLARSHLSVQTKPKCAETRGVPNVGATTSRPESFQEKENNPSRNGGGKGMKGGDGGGSVTVWS